MIFLPGSVFYIVAHSGLEAAHEILTGRPQLLYDLVPLVDVVGAGEEHPASDHLAHDAAHGPDVHVLLVPHAQDHFWCPEGTFFSVIYS